MGFIQIVLFATALSTAHAGAAADDVSNVIRAVRETGSYAQWQASGQTPGAVFAHARDSGQLSALCQQLSHLSMVDLALFDEEIESCDSGLQARLGAYWRQKADEMKDLRSESFTGIDAIARPPKTKAIPVLPNIEVEVDPMESPTYFDAGLPKRFLALTFDDGPRDATTPGILSILKQAKVRATFFNVGVMAKAHPELTRAEFEQGHSVGSHTWNHPFLTRLRLRNGKMDEQKVALQVQSARELVAEITGFDTAFFRFPYGDRNTDTAAYLRGQHMAAFQWNIDAQDYAHPDPQVVLQNFHGQLKRVEHGIALFHDTKKQTMLALPSILDELKQGGYTTVVFVRKRGTLP